MCLQSQLPNMQRACTVFYCHLWPVRLYHILPNCSFNDIIFVGEGGRREGEKEISKWNMCFDFILQQFSFERGIVINIHRSLCKVHAIRIILQQNVKFLNKFRKIIKCQISQNSFLWEQNSSMWKDGRTDRRDEANSHFSQCCKSAHKHLFLNTTVTNEGHGKWGSTHISYLRSAGFVSPRGYRPLFYFFPRYYNQAMIKKSTIISHRPFKIHYPSTVLSYVPLIYISILFCIINIYC